MDLFDVAGVIVRGLEDERFVLQGGVEGDALHRVRAEISLAELFVAVFMRAAGIFAVVEMYRAQLVEADDCVEPGQYAVEIADDVVAGVPDVTGVEAHAEFVTERHAVDDFAEFFKTAADLRALARHRFEQDGGLHSGEQHAVERLGDQFDALFRTLTGVRAGVEVVKLTGEVLHPLDVLLQHIQAVFAGCPVRRAEVHRIAPVGDQIAEPMFFEQGVQRRRVLGDDIFAFPPARIARKVGEGIPAEPEHRFAHCLIAVCHAQVTADIDHSTLRFASFRLLYCDTNRGICLYFVISVNREIFSSRLKAGKSSMKRDPQVRLSDNSASEISCFKIIEKN